MASILNRFHNLKAGIVGTQTSQIDKQIDTAIHNIQSYTSKISRNAYMDVFKDLVSAAGGPDINPLLKDLNQQTALKSFQQVDRIKRYDESEAILSHISYCQRALKVLVDNILAPDDITKRSIQILSDQENTDELDKQTETTLARLRSIKNNINIEKYSEKLVTTTLKKGDYFIEILYSPQGQHALSVVTEQKELQTNIDIIENDPIPFSIKLENIEEKNHTVKKGRIRIIEAFTGAYSNMPVIAGPNTQGGTHLPTTSIPYTIEPQSKAPQKSGSEQPKDPRASEDKFKSKYDDDPKPDKEKGVKLRDLFLAFHDPKYIVKLETERFRMCLGYLVFPKIENSGIQSSFYQANTNDVDSICINILNQLEKKIKSNKDSLPKTGDLREIVAKYLKMIKDNKDLFVRYVPPNMMSHWYINKDKYDPYGTGIFDCVSFDAKLLMALKTAATIKQITSATDKRVISVETGLPRNAKNLVEMLKEGMRKRKVSIDQFGSLDSIPSHISTFEDIYIPMRDGRKFVEFEHRQWGPNPNEDTENLKFMRDNIVANLGVPAPFLGLEENTSNRSLLTVENIMFARTIISYQREFSLLLKDLFEKIYLLQFPKNIDDMDQIKITFPPPKASPYEHQMEYIEQMTRIVEALKTLGVSQEWTKKKFLPDLPWDEIEKVNAKEKVEREAGSKTADQEEMAGGMGGIMGGY